MSTLNTIADILAAVLAILMVAVIVVYAEDFYARRRNRWTVLLKDDPEVTEEREAWLTHPNDETFLFRTLPYQATERRWDEVKLEAENACYDLNHVGQLPSRVWYWPPWQLTNPLWPPVWHGGDEHGRRTLVIQPPLLGALIIAEAEPSEDPT